MTQKAIDKWVIVQDKLIQTMKIEDKLQSQIASFLYTLSNKKLKLKLPGGEYNT